MFCNFFLNSKRYGPPITPIRWECEQFKIIFDSLSCSVRFCQSKFHADVILTVWHIVCLPKISTKVSPNSNVNGNGVIYGNIWDSKVIHVLKVAQHAKHLLCTMYIGFHAVAIFFHRFLFRLGSVCFWLAEQWNDSSTNIWLLSISMSCA